MAANVLVDTSFLVAFLNRRDAHHDWAKAQAARSPLPWRTCEPVLSEAFHLLGSPGTPRLIDLLATATLLCDFHLAEHQGDILKLLKKYFDVPMSLADACLVRMTETLSDPLLFTADRDFGIYRRNNRQTIPCKTPH
jgi:predicted nucleic acid-binding protein